MHTSHHRNTGAPRGVATVMDLQVVLPDESRSMPARTLVDLARAAEELEYTTAWLPDHVLPPADWGATFGGVFEPLVTISHLAAHTVQEIVETVLTYRDAGAAQLAVHLGEHDRTLDRMESLANSMADQ